MLIDAPALPKSRLPLPLRLVTSPGVEELLSRLMPPSPMAMVQLAGFIGEQATPVAYPDQVAMPVG
ncbi:hypothetical protein BH20ACT5_BH20ACT5_13110 [soil metagenome]